MSNRLSIGIVGGGMAGLYCAWKLATKGHSITLFECLDHFGGRIETRSLGDFKAECGPMRFELALQPLFKKLAKDELGAEFDKFSEPTGGTAEFPRYLLADTEKSTAQVTEEEREAQMRKGEVPLQQSHLTSSLDLLKLGVYRILYPKQRRVSLPKVVNYRILDQKEQQELLRSAGLGKGDPPENDEPPKWEPVAESKAAEKLRMPEEIIQKMVRSGEIPFYTDPDDGQRYVYLKIPLIAEIADGVKSAEDFNNLRSENQLLKDEDQLLEDEKEEVRPLYTIGFWNALAHVLSPGAVGKIRDLATFYHLMPENPSAAEQTIFWLRLFRSDAQLSTIPEGVDIVVTNLVKKLKTFDKRDVLLLNNATVTRVSPGDMRGHKVRLTVESDQLARNDYDFDHVIFALPQWPLRRLASAFPKPIQKHIEEVIAFSLLKVFVVVDNPWWHNKIRPQHGAHMVPTRELHYQCQTANNRNSLVGMMMLYTDRPAARYWQPYVLKPHTQAQEREPPALKNELAWHLLSALYRDHENYLKRLSAKALAETPLSESDTSRPEDVEARNQLRKEMHGSQVGLEEKIDNLSADQIAEILEDWKSGLTPRAQELRDKAKKDESDAIRDLAGTIKTFAIRDWAQPPFGAAAHVWAPGVDTQDALRNLKAFSLLGEEGVRNLHVCGEAYSDYQGFIEGALRSSEAVVKEIPELGKP